jgi:hypothetical protein
MHRVDLLNVSEITRFANANDSGHGAAGLCTDTADAEGCEMNEANAARLEGVLAEIRDNQKEALALHREHLSLVQRHYERAERINDRAEQIQAKSGQLIAGARRILTVAIPVLIVLIAYVSWLMFRR